MWKNYFSILLLLIVSIQISSVFSSVEITLSSSMEDTTADSYEIKDNILTLNSDEEYIIKGTCSECGIEVSKGLSPTITLSSITIDNSVTGPFIMKKRYKCKFNIRRNINNNR